MASKKMTQIRGDITEDYGFSILRLGGIGVHCQFLSRIANGLTALRWVGLPQESNRTTAENGVIQTNQQIMRMEESIWLTKTLRSGSCASFWL